MRQFSTASNAWFAATDLDCRPLCARRRQAIPKICIHLAPQRYQRFVRESLSSIDEEVPLGAWLDAARRAGVKLTMGSKFRYCRRWDQGPKAMVGFRDFWGEPWFLFEKGFFCITASDMKVTLEFESGDQRPGGCF